MESRIQDGINKLNLSTGKNTAAIKDIVTSLKQYLPVPTAKAEEHHAAITKELDKIVDAKSAFAFAKWLHDYNANLKKSEPAYAKFIETFLKKTKKQVKDIFIPKDEVAILLRDEMQKQFHGFNSATKEAVFQEEIDRYKNLLSEEKDEHAIENIKIEIDYLKARLKGATTYAQADEKAENLDIQQKKFILEFNPDMKADTLIKFAEQHLAPEKQTAILQQVSSNLKFLSADERVTQVSASMYHAEAKKAGSPPKETPAPAQKKNA